MPEGVPVTGPDRWYYPVDPGGTVIDVTEAGSTATVQVVQADQLYFNHAEAANGPLIRPGFLQALEDALNAAPGLSNTYVVESATPIDHSIAECGMVIRRTAGGATFEINFAVSDGVDPRLLGFDEGAGTIGTTSGEIQSSYSLLGVQDFYTPHSDDFARRKKPIEREEIKVSSEDVRFAHQVEVGQPMEGRRFVYENVPAAHIEDGLADTASFAGPAGLPAGDTHNTFWKMWRSASKQRELICVHNHREDHQITSHPFEIGVFMDREQRADPENCLDDADDIPGGYNVNFSVQLAESNL